MFKNGQFLYSDKIAFRIIPPAHAGAILQGRSERGCVLPNRTLKYCES
jgi:hypothetical protein